MRKKQLEYDLECLNNKYWTLQNKIDELEVAISKLTTTIEFVEFYTLHGQDKKDGK